MTIHNLLLLAVLAAALGCSATETEDPRETTPGNTAIANLNARIDGVAAAYERTESLDFASTLVDLWLTRSQYLGSYSDLEAARALIVSLRETRGTDARVLLMGARVHSARHEFARALDDLRAAAQLGVESPSLEATIFLARGEKLDEVLATREAAYRARPSFGNTTSLAAAHAALGHFDEADALFAEAVASYLDVSPLPLAWTSFQRGVMWAEQADDPDRAIAHYREAVRLVPDYVVANVHLAELEAQRGQLDLALYRLEEVAEWTEDPEPGGLLSELLAETQPDIAAAHAHLAASRYQQLMDEAPLAFLDHASELFAGPGPARDPQRAIALALSNLEHRWNARAFIVALGAAGAADDQPLVCDLVSRSSTTEGVNLNLNRLRLEASCPR
jgi:tetratricopeptide (TPR) repeat protein